MAEPIHTNSAAPAVSLHSLPCTIHHSGPAQVSTYFIVKQEPLRAAFRGREMFGAEVHVPDGHQGVMLREGGGQWNVVGRFASYVNWQRTPVPPNDPAWTHAFTVLPALHTPVTEEQVAARLKAAAPAAPAPAAAAAVAAAPPTEEKAKS